MLQGVCHRDGERAHAVCWERSGSLQYRCAHATCQQTGVAKLMHSHQAECFVRELQDGNQTLVDTFTSCLPVNTARMIGVTRVARSKRLSHAAAHDLPIHLTT